MLTIAPLGKKTCGQFVDRIYSTWLISDGKECQRLQNAKKFLVAATFEKANTYVFAELVIMNPKNLPHHCYPKQQPNEFIGRGWKRCVYVLHLK